MHLFSTDISEIIDFAPSLSVNGEEENAANIAKQLQGPYKRDPRIKSGQMTTRQLNDERLLLAKEYPADARNQAATKRKLRAEALGLTPEKQQAFDEARKTLGSSTSQRAAIRKHLATINDSTVSAEARDEATRQLNKVVKSPDELRKITKAYETVAETRKGAKSVAPKGKSKGYNVTPVVAGKSTASERALQAIKGAEEEFIGTGLGQSTSVPAVPKVSSKADIKKQVRTATSLLNPENINVNQPAYRMGIKDRYLKYKFNLNPKATASKVINTIKNNNAAKIGLAAGGVAGARLLYKQATKKRGNDEYS